MQRKVGATETPARPWRKPKGPSEVTFDLFPLKGEIPERASRKADKELKAYLESFREERTEWDDPTAHTPVAATKSR